MRIYIEEITDTARYHRLKISISEMQFSYSRSNLDFLDRIIINNTVKVQICSDRSNRRIYATEDALNDEKDGN